MQTAGRSPSDQLDYKEAVGAVSPYGGIEIPRPKCGGATVATAYEESRLFRFDAPSEQPAEQSRSHVLIKSCCSGHTG